MLPSLARDSIIPDVVASPLGVHDNLQTNEQLTSSRFPHELSKARKAIALGACNAHAHARPLLRGKSGDH